MFTFVAGKGQHPRCGWPVSHFRQNFRPQLGADAQDDLAHTLTDDRIVRRHGASTSLTLIPSLVADDLFDPRHLAKENWINLRHEKRAALVSVQLSGGLVTDVSQRTTRAQHCAT